jgi:hypothetical protein
VKRGWGGCSKGYNPRGPTNGPEAPIRIVTPLLCYPPPPRISGWSTTKELSLICERATPRRKHHPRHNGHTKVTRGGTLISTITTNANKRAAKRQTGPGPEYIHIQDTTMTTTKAMHVDHLGFSIRSSNHRISQGSHSGRGRRGKARPGTIPNKSPPYAGTERQN